MDHAWTLVSMVYVWLDKPAGGALAHASADGPLLLRSGPPRPPARLRQHRVHGELRGEEAGRAEAEHSAEPDAAHLSVGAGFDDELGDLATSNTSTLGSLDRRDGARLVERAAGSRP